MDSVRGLEDRYKPDISVEEPTIDIGNDERRMHVRAYNHWVSLLRGHACPSIEALDPAAIDDFGPHSVLLDLTRGKDHSAIAFLGSALRDECALDSSVTEIAQVPSRSLLSRLTDHYLQIIANRAPIGFEAEFVSSRGHNTMYRGILMPFSSDNQTIDYVYGVINWKELVDTGTQEKLDAEVAAAVRAAPRPVTTAPAWADGPGAHHDNGDNDGPATTAPRTPGDLADQLSMAQHSAVLARAADARGRAALHRALGRAHDFAIAADRDPAGYEQLLHQAGIPIQLSAPMRPIVTLVFGTDYDQTLLADYTAVLSHGRRLGVAERALEAFLDGTEGGIPGVVTAERALCRAPTEPGGACHVPLENRPSLASLSVARATTTGEYVVLLARAGEDGRLDVVATLDDAALIDQAIRAAG